MSPRLAITTALGALVAGLALAACGEDGSNGDGSNASLPQGSEPVDLNPADFTTRIDNPYWPMAPGSRWVYRETDTEGTKQRVVVTVTPRTKEIANGVEARVVRDVVTENGQPVEVTDDWYAQDSDGQHLVPGRGHRGVRERQGDDHRGLLRGRRRRGAGRRDRARQIPSPGSPTGRSTTPARPRTRPRSSASTSRPRCRSATSPAS